MSHFLGPFFESEALLLRWFHNITRFWTISAGAAFAKNRSYKSLGLFRLSVVLLQFPVERFAADAEGAGGVGFVTIGVVERGFDGLAFDLFHRRRHSDLKRRRAAFARSFGALDFDPV